MLLQFAFLAFYVIIGFKLDAVILNFIMIIQCVVSILQRQKTHNEVISPLIIFYFSSILISYGNNNLIGIMFSPENKSYSYIVPENVSEASLIWCVGATFIFIGYYLFDRFSFPSISYDLNEKAVQSFFIVLLMISIFSPVLSKVLSFLGSIYRLVSLSGTLGVMFYARLWAKEDSKKYGSYAVLLFFIQTTNALFFAYLRFELIAPALVLILGYIAGKNSVKAVFSSKVVPFVIVLFLFVASFSILSRYRGNYAQVFMKEIFNKNEKEVDPFAGNSERQTSLITRVSCVAQISNIIRLVNENDFYGGVASAPILTALIPRFLWPEKPNIELGLWFALEIGAAYAEEGQRGNNSVNMTIPGQLYLDFGWIGIVIGCILFGGFVAMLWNAVGFFRSSYNILGIIFGGYLLMYSFYAPTLDLQIVVTFLSIYLLLSLINRILNANQSKT
jgi:hypothetical protein